MSAAGVAFLREFMGDEWPATMLDAEQMAAGVWVAMSDKRAES